MLFHFTGIKNTFEKNYTVDYLIEGEDYNKPKAFLGEETIIVLGFDEFKEEPQSFGNFYAEIKAKSGNTAKFIGQADTIEEFISQLVNMDLNVISVGGYAEEIPEEKTKPIIERLVKQLEERKEIAKRKKEEAQKKNMLHYTDDRLKKAYGAIDQVVEQIDQLMAIGDGNILPETRKKFDDIRGEIAKLRLATNIDKIVDELHSALNLIVETQDYLLEKLGKEKVFSVVPGSQVTNIEVIREQTRLVKSRILQTIGAPMTTEESSYVQLGQGKLFASFIEKDIRAKMQDKFPIIRNCFGLAELMILFVILEMVLLSVFGSFVGIELSLQRYGIIFLYSGVLAWLFRIINTYIRPQTFVGYGGCLVLLALIYVGIMYALKIILVF